MQDRSGAGLVPAEQADRLHLLEVLEPSACRRMDHAEETAVLECGCTDTWPPNLCMNCECALAAVPCARPTLAWDAVRQHPLTPEWLSLSAAYNHADRQLDKVDVCTQEPVRRRHGLRAGPPALHAAHALPGADFALNSTALCVLLAAPPCADEPQIAAVTRPQLTPIRCTATPAWPEPTGCSGRWACTTCSSVRRNRRSAAS